MNIDHVVLWVEDARRALDFYVDVIGLGAVRADEFAAGDVGFPSVRLNDSTIVDLMETRKAQSTAEFTGGNEDSAGHPVNHLCLSMSRDEFDALLARLEGAGVEVTSGSERSFGARGPAEKSVYFNDPDGNVIELRFYADDR